MAATSTTQPEKVNPVRKLVVLLVLLALMATACSSDDATVATVNGTAITLGEVEAIRLGDTIADRDLFNQDLFQLIVEETVRQAAEAQYGIVADQAAVDAQFDTFMASIEQQGAVDEYMENNGITEETIRHVAFQQVMLPAIQAKLAEEQDPFTEADLQLAYESLLPSLSTVCTRHILVGTEEEAETVIDRLDEGEEFADLAAELSIDEGSGAAGGDIGCISDPSSNLVSTYAAASLDAEIGEVTGPVPSEFGYHVLIVDSREVPVFEEIRSDLETSLAGERAADIFDDWVYGKLGEANVVVTERYGTWQTEPTFGVNSPA